MSRTGIITSYLVLRYLEGRGVAVEKLAHFDFAEIASCQEALESDFSRSPRHFLSPDFLIFSGKPTFSTATGIITISLNLIGSEKRIHQHLSTALGFWSLYNQSKMPYPRQEIGEGG
jgi:hypothetical protein